MKSWIAFKGLAAFALLAVASFTTPLFAADKESEGLVKSPDSAAAAPVSSKGDAVDEWIQNNGGQTEKSSYLLRRSDKKNTDNASAPVRRVKASPISMQTMWPMLAVLGTIVLIALGVRKWMPRGARVGGGQAVKVLARQYLAGKHSVCLVRLGRRVLLLGVSPDRVTTLTEIVDPAETSALLATVEQGRPQSFTTEFSQFMQTDASATESQELEEDEVPVIAPAASHRELFQTGENVRGLVDRIRALSAGATETTKSPSRRR